MPAAHPDIVRAARLRLPLIAGLLLLALPQAAVAADCPRSDGSYHEQCSLMRGDFDNDAPVDSGYVVARNDDDTFCYLHDIANGTTSRLSLDIDCQEPLVSPDGSYVVYTRGRTDIRMVALPDGAPVTVGTGRHPHPWFDDQGELWIYYTTDSGNSREKTWWPDTGYGIKTRREKVSTGECQTLLNWKAAGGPSRDGRFLGQGYATMMLFDTDADTAMKYRPCDDDGGTYHGTAYELYGGGQGCNPSMAPDNSYRLMHLYLPHLYFGFRDKDDSEHWRIIHDNAYEEWQTPEWSTDPDWATATLKHDNGRYGVVAIQISSRHTYEVPGMGVSDGDWKTPHLFLGEATAPPPPADPALHLETGSATMGAINGGDNPPSQTIAISNTGGGTLASAIAAVDYSNGDGWLSTAISGSGNAQELSLHADVGGLSAGNYAATVTITAGSAPSQTVDVDLTVSDSISLFDLHIYADDTQVVVGGSLELWAVPVDQTDDAYAATITWSIAGGGSFTESESSGAVETHATTFLSDGSEGSFEVTVTATAGGDTTSKSFNIDVYTPNEDFAPPPPPVNEANEPANESTAPDDSPIVMQGGCAMNASGWAPAWSGVLFALWFAIRRRRR